MEEEATKKPAAPKALYEQSMLNKAGKAFPQAQNYTLGEIEQKRVTGLQLYNRDQFPGDEQIIGRSRYVTSDTFDNVEWTLASLMALFDGQEKVVQFNPTGPEDEALAEQQTDIVNHIVTGTSTNALVLHNWLKNGLIGGLGVVTAEYYKDKRWKPAQVLQGVPNSHAVELENSEDHEILEAGEPYAIPGMEHIPGMEMRDLKVREAKPASGVKIYTLAPEDFFVSRDAQFDFQTGGIDAALQGYKRTLPRAELIEMGYDAEKVNRIPASSGSNSTYAFERNKDQGHSDGTGDVEEEVDLYEIFMRMDANGDGVRELVHLTIGGDPASAAVLLAHEEVELAPFAAFVPYMMPNTLNGMSVGDLVGKDQRLKSQLMRGINDNLTQVLRPQRVVTGGVNIDDLLNSAPDSIIRADKTDAISTITTPFVGGQAFGVVDMINQSVEHRTGVGPNLMGVDPTQLQNTTATASSQRQTMSQLRVELIARMFAETGYRYLFRMVTSLLIANMEDTKALAVRLRGNWVPFGTDQWSPDLDIKANITFGITDKPQKLAALNAILQQQMTAMQAGTPMTDMGKIYNTLALIAEHSGFKNAERFWNNPAKQGPGAGAPPPEKPDPAAQAEQAKMQMEMQRMQMEMQLKHQQMEMNLQMQREQFQAKMELEKYKLEQELALRREEIGVETQLKGFQMMTQQNTQPQIKDPQ